MIDVLVWNKYTRIVMQLAKRLDISQESCKSNKRLQCDQFNILHGVENISRMV